jgi:hypothetical protein
MTTAAVTVNSTALLMLAKQINEREETIAGFRGQVENTLRLAAPEIILQGQALLAAKAHLKHGDWEAWLKAHCTKIPARTARRYMARALALQANGSLEEYYHLLCEDDTAATTTATQSKQWLPYVEILGRVARFSASFSKCPVDKWPEPGLVKLKELLEPTARQLWPERFN